MNFLRLFILVCFGALVNNASGKVDPPNYDFSLDALKVFLPGTTIAEMEKTHGKGMVMEKNPDTTVYKFYVSHIRYKFPVFVQTIEGRSVDFMARLPSYFSHDIFHQSLINRYGKQNEYRKKEEHAVYIWKNQAGNRHVYQGGCSIQCFPMYYAVQSNTPQTEVLEYKSLLKKFVDIAKSKISED